MIVQDPSERGFRHLNRERSLCFYGLLVSIARKRTNKFSEFNQWGVQWEQFTKNVRSALWIVFALFIVRNAQIVWSLCNSNE